MEKFISINELPLPIKEYAEYLREDIPEYLEHIQGWYEDTYNGVTYQAFTEGLSGGTYCIDIASRYMDHEGSFFNWIDRNSKEVIIEFDYAAKNKQGYSDIITLSATKLSKYDPWKVYVGNYISEDYTVIKVNGKKKGFILENKILVLDK